jgi:Tol biopolymer transport system component
VSPQVGSVRAAEWSPDGTRLAYEVESAGDGFYIMDANGTHQVPVPGWSLHRWWSWGLMTWSHDGTRLAIMAPHPDSGSNGPAGLYVYDVSTLDASFIAGSETFEPTKPIWSWDDTRLAFGGGAFARPPATGVMHVVSVDGSDPVDLKCGGYEGRAWQPHGDLLAYQVDAGLAVSPSDGSTTTTIVDGAALFRWSSDGSRLAYTRGTWDRTRELGTVSPDGSDARTILRLSEPAPIRDLTWSPDGRYVAIRVDENSYGRQSWRLVAADGSDQGTSLDALPIVDEMTARVWMEG